MYHVYRCACLFLHPLQCIDTVALHRYFIVDNCYCLHDTVMGIIVFILNDDRFYSKYVGRVSLAYQFNNCHKFFVRTPFFS